MSGNDFWSFGNGNGNGSAHSQTLGTGTGMKNFIPNFWERERENSIPNFWEREWKFHSRISGTGMAGEGQEIHPCSPINVEYFKTVFSENAEIMCDTE